VEFVLGTLALEQDSLRALRVSCIRIIPLLLHSTMPFIYHQDYTNFANENLRSLHFWNNTWRRSAVSCWHFEKSVFYPQAIAWPLKKGPIDYTETSLTKYQSTLRNTPEDWRSHLHRGGNLESRTWHCLNNTASHCSPSPMISTIHGNIFCRPPAWFPKIRISLNAFVIFTAQ